MLHAPPFRQKIVSIFLSNSFRLTSFQPESVDAIISSSNINNPSMPLQFLPIATKVIFYHSCEGIFHAGAFQH